MDNTELLRVVTLRKGKLKPVEFRIRQGERGLSLFWCKDRSTAESVVEAVRAMGKHGDLGAAILQTDEIRALGLRLVRTPGGTGVPEIDAMHVEARLPLLRQLWLFLRGIRPYDYFNEHLSPQLCAIARLQE